MNKEIVKKYSQTNKFGKLLDMQYRLDETGDIIYDVTITEKHLATTTAAHGGLLAAMMDGVVGVAALEKASKSGNVVSTVEMKLNFLQPALLNDQLKGIGKVLKAGKRIIVVEGKIFNQHNQLLAIGIATMNAYPIEKSDLFK